MFSVKLLSFFILIITFYITLSFSMPDSKKIDDEKQKEIDCTITRKCSTFEDIVYATDGTQCYLYRNPCIFATEMCMRRAKNKNGKKTFDFSFEKRLIFFKFLHF